MLPAPDAGSTFSTTLKAKISRMPRKNVGTEEPSTEMPRSTRSTGLSGQIAEKMPNGRPKTVAMAMASTTSSAVTGTRSSSSRIAGWPL